MSRLTLLAFAFFTSVLLALASPVPVVNRELVNIEARLTRVGRGTWYYPGLGNCGDWNTSSDLILAIGKGLYDRNGGGNCNQYVQITNTANGKTAIGLTKDSCQSCGDNDIDMSPALFEKLGSLSTSVLKVSWHFMNKDWKP
ncbi:RlpA-like double-psi beta-barrel-protein domain-containing protein-containing protein [Gymnopilus junonius]|uniref:RlpA-like double-psi beta-barrel-protein domain-containing protein-containing protein n=1 Tax=Gymnopilus junonius TaxID=109634 RepID=A0A9P5TQ79_GYMJU|nr:RlpA-like double-psi beta-barrel-protein domain-containing protein-containing protein [Gymnopilus junonius]